MLAAVAHHLEDFDKTNTLTTRRQVKGDKQMTTKACHLEESLFDGRK